MMMAVLFHFVHVTLHYTQATYYMDAVHVGEKSVSQAKSESQHPHGNSVGVYKKDW
jgi:hypothetical protein